MRMGPREVGLLVLTILLATLACAREDRPARPALAATIHPLGALARVIAAPDADVLVLLPPGASPHSFEPSPRTVAAGGGVSVVLRDGAGLDDWARPIVARSIREGAREIVAVEMIAARPGHTLLPALGPAEEDGHGESGGEGETDEQDDAAAFGHIDGPIDPHVWLDPLLMVPVCRAVGEALSAADPANGAAYEERTAVCLDSLRALDRQLAAILAPVRGVPFVATHNAWAYLARRYGLRIVDVVQRVPTQAPGPRRMVEILRAAADARARAVFTEVQVSEAAARTVADELGVRVTVLDPQGTPDDPERDSYFDLLRWNARRIAASLQGGEE